MRTTTIHCNTCGDVILSGHSITEARHGEPATRYDEPIDDWLRSGRQNAAFAPEAAPVGPAVAMTLQTE
jgi:hypothetical protein